MLRLTIVVILFGIVLTQSACTRNPTEDLPTGVWESEAPYMLIHVGSSYVGQDTSLPLGIYRLNGEEIKVFVRRDPRMKVFQIFDIETFAHDVMRNEYRLFDGAYHLIDENSFRVTGRCDITGERMEIMFYRVEGHDPIDARDWGYPWRRD